MSSKAFAELIRWGLALFCGLLALLFWGCGAKAVTVIEYKVVEVPVKCSVDMPAKPSPDGDAMEVNFRVLEYSKKLEAALKACK